MKPANMILRNIDPALVDWARKRYTWRTGSIPPYSSLWITVLRFALLNRPKFASLNSDLQGEHAASLRRVIKFDSNQPWPSHETIDVRSFSQMLGEPLEAFRWSCAGHFPLGIQRMFSRNTWICPSCIAQGFHTIIFSITCIHFCPLHGDMLTHSCPECGESLDNRSKPNSGILPRLCHCSYSWLSMRLARRPLPDTARDEAIGDVVRWAESVSRRCWTYLPTRQRVEHSLQVDTLQDHIQRWHDELSEPIPDWVTLRLRERPEDPSYVRCIERSGIERSSLARLQGAGMAFFSRTPPVVPGEMVQEAFRIFKSIRRYLVNHVLGNRVRLMVWIGKNLSAPEFRQRLIADPYTRVAWAILYWMQCSHWGDRSARAWFKKLLGVPMFAPYKTDPTYHWTQSIQDHVVIHHGTEAAEVWIVNWINASALMDVWPTQQDFECYSGDEGFLWPQGPSRRLPIRWWAWLGDDGRLAMGIYRRRPAWWVPVARQSKEERRTAFEEGRMACLKELRDAMSEPVIRLHDDGIWRVEERRVFSADADLRSSRLHFHGGPASRFGVGRDPLPAADPATPWLVRSLEYPVCVCSKDIRSGVLNLKHAVRTYIRRLGSGSASR